MKKITIIAINVIISIIILVGILFIVFINKLSFSSLAKDDIENISKLSSLTIYAEIDNSLTKPIFVGLTMANDLFLKNWLKEENSTTSSPEQLDTIKNYLALYRQKYNYDSVFVVSERSSTYYHYEGVNKIISTENAHDVWYYDFVKSGLSYDLDVDTDQANNDELTVFVNCRIMDDNGTFLGVVGVGVKMSNLQQMLLSYEKNYDLKATLIDPLGVVQVDSDVANIETVNFFEQHSNMQLKDKLESNGKELNIYWESTDKLGRCIITQYIDNLDWYIVIEKDTAKIENVLNAQFGEDIAFIAIIIALVLIIVIFTINKYNRLLVRTAITDKVTNLPNCKLFYEMYNKNAKRSACKTGTVFIFDIDNFKTINDLYGHLEGNTVLYQVSAIAKEIIGNKGIVGRFGGDEFIGALYAEPLEADTILRKILEAVHRKDLKDVTISIGATRMNNKKLDTYVKEADNAMYKIKDIGGNGFVVHS